MKIHQLLKTISSLCLFVLFSCYNSTKCNIEPINKNVIDTLSMKGDILFKNDKGDIDTLVLLDNYNIIRKETIKSFMNFKECAHSIGFDYKLNNNGETLSILLHKNANNEYLFSVNGFCIGKDIVIKTIKKDTTYLINVEKCEKSRFNKIALKNFKIEYFETQNGDIWKPMKLIPR